MKKKDSRWKTYPLSLVLNEKLYTTEIVWVTKIICK